MNKGSSNAHTPFWQWPIDVMCYDRTPTFSEAERQAAQQFYVVRQRVNTYITFDRQAVLQRILLPVTDALVCLKLTAALNAAIRCGLLEEMGRCEGPFWAWSEQDWLNFLKPTGEEWSKDHHRGARPGIIAVAGLLTPFTSLWAVSSTSRYPWAVRIFGQAVTDTAVQRVSTQLVNAGFAQTAADNLRIRNAVSDLLLLNRNPHLEALTLETLDSIRRASCSSDLQSECGKIGRALLGLGITTGLLRGLDKDHRPFAPPSLLTGIYPEWLQWCQRWLTTTTLSPSVRRSYFYQLASTGRWLMKEHPDITSPAQWTRELAADFIAAVDRMRVDDWGSEVAFIQPQRRGQPMMPRGKARYFGTLRTFFRDCQEWGWMPRRFDPNRCLATPRSISALIGPAPRVIDDALWAKLLWAGLNLTADDVPFYVGRSTGGIKSDDPALRDKRVYFYPFPLVKAMVLTWLFCALRSDEFVRLRVGCIRMQAPEHSSAKENSPTPICWLDVPVNKTSTAFTKPVDLVVGKAIQEWEQVRPLQPARLDPKTGESVQFLFCYRGKPVGKCYINEVLIPLLCRKAGVPEQDARGRLTSHRARATMVTQLHNAKEGMSLFELMQWLGHRYADSTLHYLKTSPTKLAKAYSAADYFRRNIRHIEVLLDQDAIRSGAAAAGEPWKYYDLGHGFCTYDFFTQCPHRMACAKCDFYLPKDSSQAQLLEVRTNLQRMMEEIPLGEEERAAVEDGLSALEKLQDNLRTVATPTRT